MGNLPCAGPSKEDAGKSQQSVICMTPTRGRPLTPSELKREGEARHRLALACCERGDHERSLKLFQEAKDLYCASARYEHIRPDSMQDKLFGGAGWSGPCEDAARDCDRLADSKSVTITGAQSATRFKLRKSEADL